MWLHTHAHREMHKKKECRAINGDWYSNLFSSHKRRNRMLMAPRFSHPQSVHTACKEERLPLFPVHLLLLQYRNAPLLSSAAGVHGGVRNLRPHLLLFITSPVDCTRSIIQSLKIVTHEKTQRLISSLMCHFTDGHAAVIAAIRNLSFCPLHTPPRALRRKGDQQSLLASFPNNTLGY